MRLPPGSLELPIPRVCRTCGKETITYHTNWPRGATGVLCDDCWMDDETEWYQMKLKEEAELERLKNEPTGSP